MRVIDPEFKIGELVYIKTDADQLARIVYCYKVYADSIIYELACGTTTSSHYAFELSSERNFLLTTQS